MVYAHYRRQKVGYRKIDTFVEKHFDNISEMPKNSNDILEDIELLEILSEETSCKEDIK